MIFVLLFTGACTDEDAAAPTAEAAPTTTEPPAEPFLAPGYPTPADTDRAFVSEVAALDGVRSFLTRDPYIVPTDLAAASAGLAQLGRGVCSSYTGDNIDTVAAELMKTWQVDNTIDGLSLDPIDATAFVVAAVGDYCPQKLVDLGEGYAMTGGVEVRPVTPQCPSEAPVTVVPSPITLTGQSNVELYGDMGPDADLVYGDTDGFYDGAWTYTVTNSSDYDVIVGIEERVVSRRYTTDWDAPDDDLGGPHAPFYVPARSSVTGSGHISGVYAWQSAEYRLSTWLPVSCQVTLQ